MFNNTGFRFAGESITGLVRVHNEDSFLICAPAGRKTALAVVADGVGGHRHGEIASYISCRELGNAFMQSSDEMLMQEQGAENFLLETVTHFNHRIFNMNYEELAVHPMSSTLTAVLFMKDAAVMAHVGDSRFYAIRNGRIEQISTDHTLANERGDNAGNSGGRTFASNVISRSIGTRYNLKLEIRKLHLTGDERFFMCSDGVYRDISDERLTEILKNAPDPESTVNQIMRSVLLEGAHDNTTVISVFPC